MQATEVLWDGSTVPSSLLPLYASPPGVFMPATAAQTAATTAAAPAASGDGGKAFLRVPIPAACAHLFDGPGPLNFDDVFAKLRTDRAFLGASERLVKACFDYRAAVRAVHALSPGYAADDGHFATGGGWRRWLETELRRAEGLTFPDSCADYCCGIGVPEEPYLGRLCAASATALCMACLEIEALTGVPAVQFYRDRVDERFSQIIFAAFPKGAKPPAASGAAGAAFRSLTLAEVVAAAEKRQQRRDTAAQSVAGVGGDSGPQPVPTRGTRRCQTNRRPS